MSAGIRDLGLRIPADISVVGFDDIELAQTTDPPLTTVHQPIRGKGEEAARLLLSVIAGRDQEAGHRRLATRLIVRASTASAPGQSREVSGF
jgi:DNA-binding LacI/PurR family transcriptional regulator